MSDRPMARRLFLTVIVALSFDGEPSVIVEKVSCDASLQPQFPPRHRHNDSERCRSQIDRHFPKNQNSDQSNDE
jgi:hypothetical protein